MTERTNWYVAENKRLRAEVERLLKELDRMTGEARKWHDRYQEEMDEIEGLRKRIEYLESEDA
jgi:predicted nuclease with TOPRIM domain